MTLLQAECHESSEDLTFTPQLPTNLVIINAQFKFTWAADKDDADKEEEKEQAADGSINAVKVENTSLYLNQYALFGNEVTHVVMKSVFMSLFGIPLEYVTPIMDLVLACGRWLAGRESLQKTICMKLKVHCHLERPTAVDALKESFSNCLFYREMTSIKIPDNAVEERAITSCGICLEDMGAGTLATKMSCSHFFHHRCISTWLTKSVTCPMCRHRGKLVTIFSDDDLIDLIAFLA